MSAMQEHRLSVPRTARYYTLGRPAPALGEAWFVCHGYGQLAGRFLRHFAPLDDGRRLVVAPEGLSRFYLDAAGRDKVGASWMTREDRLAEIADYVQYLDAVRADALRGATPGDPRSVLLGFSQGASTVCRWAVMGKVRVERLVVWGGEVPPDLDPAAAAGRLRGVRVFLVFGRGDELFPPKAIAALEARLREPGIAFERIDYDGGHEIDAAILKQIAAA